MLNFKFIKLGWFFVLAFILFSQNVSLAQEKVVENGGVTLRSLNIKDVKIETNGTEIKVSGKLFNQSQNIATDKITHLLMLETIDPLIKPKNEIDQMPSLIVSADEGDDYFSLDPNKQKSFSYSLTVSQYVPEANYRLSLRFIRSSGQEEAYYSNVIKNLGSSKKEGFLAFDQQSCVLFNKEGETFGRNSGPAFLPGESPKISCLIKNIGNQEIEVYPNILWKEGFVYSKPLEGKLAEEKQDEKIFFNPGESKTITLFMPITEKPQTYQGALSFEDKNGASRSFNEFFRWTIAGESARIKAITQIGEPKDFYNKGDKVALSVDYFGSSDLYWAGTRDVSNLSEMTMKAVIKDKNGSICGEKEETLDDITDGFSKNKVVEIILDKKCKEMSYSVSLSSGQKWLAEQSGDLPKVVNKQNILQFIYFGLPAFLILLAFYIFIRKKSVPVYFFTILFFAVAILSGTALAVTKIYPANGGVAYNIYWGGQWTGVGSATLYSTSYGTGGVNILSPYAVTAQLDGFFISNSNIGSVQVDYYTDDTSCVNTSMEVEYEVLITADGLAETLLTIKRIGYNSNTGYQVENVSIPSANIQSLYDISSGIPRKNPKIIVKMKQIGVYKGGSFYPGLFNGNQSTITTQENAYALADIIRVEIPLLLPTPTLRINPPTATLNLGETKQFEVFYDADGTGSSQEENVTTKIAGGNINNWSSRNATVVKIDETGIATAVAPGTTIIKAVYYRGLNAKAQIYVPTLRINPASTTMNPGDIKQFESWYDQDGPGKIFSEKEVTKNSAWSSDNSFVASVKNNKSDKGEVTALKVGQANIIANYEGLGASSPVSVVSAPIPLAVSCLSNPSSVFINETTNFSANVIGGKAPYSYKWTGVDNLSGTSETVKKAYLTTGIKTATVEIKDNVGAVKTASCSVTINSVDQPKYTLTVKKIGKGFVSGGTGDSVSISCGANCSQFVEEYGKDAVVWLTGEADNGWKFKEWNTADDKVACPDSQGSGHLDENNDPTCDPIIMDSNKEVTVTFEPEGECGVSKNQCSVGSLDDVADNETHYLWKCVGTASTDSCSLKKDKVTVFITADNNSVNKNEVAVISWGSTNATSCSPSGGGDDTSWVKVNIGTLGSFETSAFGASGRTYAISCTDGNTTATDSVAITIIEPKTLTVAITGNGMDIASAVKSADGVIDCTSNCTEEYSYNTEVTLTATPVTGYFLEGWGGDTCDSVNGNSCTLTMDAGKSVTATFIKEGAITIAASDISATIVAGLSTKSKNDDSSKVTVSSNYCNGSVFDFDFEYVGADGGPGEAYWGKAIFNISGADLGTKDFIIKNIPGKTLAGKYQIKITATCTDSVSGEPIGMTKTIYLIVKKIFSNWQEV